MLVKRNEVVLSNGIVSLYDLGAILKRAGCTWHAQTKTRRISATPGMRAAIAKARERAQAREAARQKVQDSRKRREVGEDATAMDRITEAVERGVNRHAASLLPIGTSIHSELYKKRVLKGKSEWSFLGILPEKLHEIRMRKLLVGPNPKM